MKDVRDSFFYIAESEEDALSRAKNENPEYDSFNVMNYTPPTSGNPGFYLVTATTVVREQIRPLS